VLSAPALACVYTASCCSAQQLIGYVSRRDATVTGWTDEVEGQAVLTGSSSVTTKEQATPIKLSRGGSVRVCQTSELKITASRDVTVAPPLLFSLDHGSIQIDTNATPSDSIMTPDLRFVIRTSGQLDLRLRVARNGDTCVENRGATAPTIAVSDAFGESMYELPAGQHVVFQHGSVRQVEEHATVPCGCQETGVSVAQALLTPAPTAKPQANNSAAVQHPFPMPASDEVIRPESSPVQAAASAPQVSEALSYTAQMKDPDDLSGDATKPMTVHTAAISPAETSSVAARGKVAPARVPAAPQAPAKALPSPAEQQPPPNDLAHLIGRALKKLFGR
jgi:hypothetical protein